MSTEKREMAENERALVRALAKCSLPPATSRKRFILGLAAAEKGDAQITEKQASYLKICVWMYRRQLKRHLPLALMPKSAPEGYLTPKQQQEALEKQFLEQRLKEATK